MVLILLLSSMGVVLENIELQLAGREGWIEIIPHTVGRKTVKRVFRSTHNMVVNTPPGLKQHWKQLFKADF